MTSWSSELHLPLTEGPKGWKPYWLHRGGSRAVSNLTCHVSILSGGRTPHELHSHPEEELLLVLDGTPQLRVQEPSGTLTTHQAGAGSLAYYPADTLHTLTNASERPATYLMFKWTNDTPATGSGELPIQLHRCLPISDDGIRPGKSWRSQRIFEGQTRWLDRLQCHTSTVNPGGGYEPHADAHDVAVVLLTGSVETEAGTLKPFDVAYIEAGEPHGMRNPGPNQARYIVFEFERVSQSPMDGL
jgi:quercetin dioxygenase-like cupin family protein